MDYKDTLNLPRTDFPMKADLVQREPERLAKWQAKDADGKDLYARIQAARASAPKFVLHDGPPFANGQVHIGTALNKILKDIVVKYKSLRGFRAPYVPGWDCHGLPIEYAVMRGLIETPAGSSVGQLRGYQQQLRQPFSVPVDALKLRKECEEDARGWAMGFEDDPQGGQMRQFQRLGVFGDWENPYLTLNKEYEADELRLFASIVEKGFVYRGKKPVYWSIPCRTALAEAEVEYKDHVSQSVFVKFPVLGHPGTSIVIWTTTPWTLPANLAVAYNSTFSYSLVRVGEEDYIVSALLLSAVAEKCGWSNYQIVRSLDAEHLCQLEYQHPFCNRTGKLFAGDAFVDNVTGTGFVHVAPGHGMEDYLLGSEHGLPIYSPVDDDGRFTHTNDLPVEQQMPGEMIGKCILAEPRKQSEANEAVLLQLHLRKALLQQEPYPHSYPHCWRSKTPIIFRAMDQWFIKIDQDTKSWTQELDAKTKLPSEPQGGPHSAVILEMVAKDLLHKNAEGNYGGTLRWKALDSIETDVDWIPDWGKSRIEAAVKSRPDWCISRQRAWGVPIPAFYDAGGEPILHPDIIRNAAKLIEQHGSNIWFEKSAAELWSLLRPSDWKGPEAVTKSADTLDVWIDSGSSSHTVIAQRPELRGADKPFQCDLYLEGSDQHRGWFQSSLLLSLAANGAAPYRTVLTHGFLVDADREKISKSKQGQTGYEKPQTAETYVNKYGADVVRLWVASQDFRNDIIVSDERIAKVGETYRGIRNTLRYQLSNLYDFDPVKHTVPDEKLTGLDRWILSEFSKLEQEVIEAYDRYEFHVVYQKVSQFVAVELSAIYHDVIKDRLYTDPANSARRRSTQTALHRLVTGLCQMLAPILAFTADEAWEFVPANSIESVHRADWRPSRFGVSDDERAVWKKLLSLREKVLPVLEHMRQSKTIGKALEAQVEMHGQAEALSDVADRTEELRELLNISQCHLRIGLPAGEAADDPKKVIVLTAKAAGQKCERCWHWETDVGSHPAHPTLCGRCVQAVKECAKG